LGGQLGKDGRGRLQADLLANPLHLEQGDTLTVDAQVRLQLTAELAAERLRFSRLDMEISSLALASQAPRASEPLRLSGDKLELSGGGGLALAGLLTGRPQASNLALSVTLNSGELRLEAPGRQPGSSTTVVAPSAEGGARLSSASMEQLAIDSLTLRAPSLAVTWARAPARRLSPCRSPARRSRHGARADEEDPRFARHGGHAARGAREPERRSVLAEGGRASLRLERAEIPLQVSGKRVDAPEIALAGGAFELRQPKGPAVKGGIPQARLRGSIEGFAVGLEGQAQITPLTVQQGDTLDLSAAADLDFALVAEPEQLRLQRCELKVRDIDARAGVVPGQSYRTADAAVTLQASGNLPLSALQAKPLDPAALPLDVALRSGSSR